MPAVCKHCGHEQSIPWLLWNTFVSGDFGIPPNCPGCGADDNTIESVSTDLSGNGDK